MATDSAGLKELTDLIQAFFSSHAVPAGAIVVPHDYKLVSTEEFQPHRARFRGRFTTTLVEDFANYYARNVEADKLAHAPVFIDPNNLSAASILDWMIGEDQPGHLQHVAVCRPLALPDWERLRDLHNRELPQDEVVDLLEDFAGLAVAFDETGQGMSPTQLIAAFRNTKITKQSEHAQSLDDSVVSRSAMEIIDANASRRAPSKLTFHVIPFPGFASRSVTARVIIRARGAEPVFTLRIVNYEGVVHELATEFVNLVQHAIAGFYELGDDPETPPIYVGNFAF